MPLKTPAQYVQSLRDLKIRAYVNGERVASIVDHPAIAPHINTVAKTYELAHQSEHRDVMTVESHLTGERNPSLHTHLPERRRSGEEDPDVASVGADHGHLLPALRRVKHNITRNVYQIGRLSHDLAGGFLATMPSQKSFDNPEIAKYGGRSTTGRIRSTRRRSASNSVITSRT